jgi:hypothetical protein
MPISEAFRLYKHNNHMASTAFNDQQPLERGAEAVLALEPGVFEASSNALAVQGDTAHLGPLQNTRRSTHLRAVLLLSGVPTVVTL